MQQEDKIKLLNLYKEKPKKCITDLYKSLDPEMQRLRRVLCVEYPMLSSIAEMLYWLESGRVDFPKCPVCGKPITAYASKHYPAHCSRKCTQLDKNVRDKNAETNMLRYGVHNGAQAEQSTRKRKETLLARYGVDNAFKSEEIKQKIRNTNLLKYGVENPRQSKQIREKAKSTLLERHGVNCGFKCAEIFNKSAGELELFDFVISHYPDAISGDRSAINPLELDIYIPSLRIGIEYDGDYWHSLPDMKRRDHLKNKICRDKNIHLIRVAESHWLKDSDRIKNLLLEDINEHRIH